MYKIIENISEQENRRIERLFKRTNTINLADKVKRKTTDDIWNTQIIQDFQKWNFFNLKFEDKFSINNPKDSLIDKELVNQCMFLFLKETYKLDNSKCQEFSESQTSNYYNLRYAITKRLEQTYNALMSETFKIYKLLEKAKQNNVHTSIISSATIDKAIGVDFYLILDNQLAYAIHSVSGSKESINKLEEKKFKKGYFKLEDEFYLYDRQSEYQEETHVTFEDIDKANQENVTAQEKIDYIDKKADILVHKFTVDSAKTETKEQSLVEFFKVNELIQRLETKEEIEFYKHEVLEKELVTN